MNTKQALLLLIVLSSLAQTCEAGFIRDALDFIFRRRRGGNEGGAQAAPPASNPGGGKDPGGKPPTGGGGNDWDCDDTLKCWSISQEDAPDGASCVGSCGKKVCLEFTGGDGCPESVSHVCDAADGDGCPRPGSAWDTTSSPKNAPCDETSDKKCEGDPPQGTKLCQYAEPGDTLYWIVKKGSLSSETNGYEMKGNNKCYMFDDWTPQGYDPNDTTEYPSCSGQTFAQRVVEYTVPADPGCGGGGPPPCVKIDFSQFAHGDYVETLTPFPQYPLITFSVKPNDAANGCEGVPRIYDTSREVEGEIDPEMEDPDLDCISQGNALIIQEGPCTEDRLPDDAETGGKIELDFQFPVFVDTITMFETEGDKRTFVRTFDEDGNKVNTKVPSVGDCGFDTFDIKQDMVKTLSVQLHDSGAIGDLTVCLPQLPAP